MKFVKKKLTTIWGEPYLRPYKKAGVYAPEGVLEWEIKYELSLLKVRVIEKIGKTGKPYLLLFPDENGEIIVAEYLETRTVSETQVQEALAIGLQTNGGGLCVLLRKPREGELEKYLGASASHSPQEIKEGVE